MILYEITTLSDIRPSPFCWRARLSLRHKGLSFEPKGIVYSQIPALGNGTFKTLPVIDDEGTWVGGSTAIAEYLESKVSQPTLFPDDPQRLFSGFVETWVDSEVQARIFPLVALCAHDRFAPSEKQYFRTTRERRLGMALEAARENSLQNLSDIRASFEPARRIMKKRQFLAGAAPGYADFLLLGAIKWQRLLSQDRVLSDDDPIESWYQRLDALLG